MLVVSLETGFNLWFNIEYRSKSTNFKPIDEKVDNNMMKYAGIPMFFYRFSINIVITIGFCRISIAIT